MKSLTCVIMVAILAGCGNSTTPAAPKATKAKIGAVTLADVEWGNAWRRQCPKHRLDWLAPSVESDLLDDFDQRLDPRAREDYDRLNDMPKFCGTEQRWGQACDIGLKRKALNEIGRLSDFAKFACARMVCIEQSDCRKP